MKILFSLKYRIALSIFIAQLVIIFLILWQVQSHSFSEAKQLLIKQDQAVIKLLSILSKPAIYNEDYFSLSPYYSKIIDDPHVLTAYLTDRNGVVVASSDRHYFGETILVQEQVEFSYWESYKFRGSDEDIGTLWLQFSKRELQIIQQNTLRHILELGIIIILLTSVFSLVMGHILTSRLEHIRSKTDLFASGDTDARCDINGKDELRALSQSFNLMADQIKDQLSEIEYLAFHDPLTGLANRREFHKRLDLAFISAQQHGHFYALFYMDLDKFKVVNDTLGHEAGDELLVEISEVILKALRTRDTLVRLGGDEFGALIENCSLSEAKEVAQKICNTVNKYKFVWHQQVMQVGISIGVVALNSSVKDISKLINLADAACYSAKQNGRNNVTVLEAANDLEKNEGFS